MDLQGVNRSTAESRCQEFASILTNPEPATNTQHLIGPDSRGPTHALPKDPIYENVTYATESPTLLLQLKAIAASIFCADVAW